MKKLLVVLLLLPVVASAQIKNSASTKTPVWVKALTPGSATEFVRVSIPQTIGYNFASGLIHWTVILADATDSQTLEGTTAFNCGNKAGTEDCAALVTALNTLVYPTAGTGKDDVTCTFAKVQSLTDAIGFSANCSSVEMTETVSNLYYSVEMLYQQTVTPQ